MYVCIYILEKEFRITRFISRRMIGSVHVLGVLLLRWCCKIVSLLVKGLLGVQSSNNDAACERLLGES